MQPNQAVAFGGLRRVGQRRRPRSRAQHHIAQAGPDQPGEQGGGGLDGGTRVHRFTVLCGTAGFGWFTEFRP
jgi:hypothetical protein